MTSPGRTDARENAWLREYAQHGSRSAFAQLVQRYAGLVHAMALRRVGGDRHLAEDVTQAVFLVLSQRASRIDGSRVALAGWLCRTTQYTANNAMRAQRRRIRHEQAAAQERSELREPPASDIVASDLWPQLDDAMDRLGDKERDAVLLRYFEGRSVRQIAAEMGIAERTAAKRLERGVAKLKAFFRERRTELSETSIGAVLGSPLLHHSPDRLVELIVSNTFAASVSSAAMAAQVARWMLWTRIKVAAVLLAGIVVVAAAATTGPVLRGAARRASGAAGGASIQVQDIRFDPVGPGKNVLHVLVKNGSRADRFVAVQARAYSTDGRNEWKGSQGRGYREYAGGRYVGQSHGPNLPAGQTTDVRYAFEIPEPFGPDARIAVDVYDNVNDHSPRQAILSRQFVAGKLAQQKLDRDQLPRADDAQSQAARALLAEVQTRLRIGLYTRSMELFSGDWQFVENAPIVTYFRRRMYPKEPKDLAAHTWDAPRLLKFEPREVRVDGERLVLIAEDADHGLRAIDIVNEDGQWRIDWVHAPVKQKEAVAR